MANPKTLSIHGARMHNLKSVDVSFPHGHLVVITGVSGSGKSSLAFDTLFAEGQRRYVESLSSYARQFLGRLEKPEVDDIKGLAPAIAIQQKVISRNPRSTVGTVTELNDYLKVLFARVGKTYSPVSGDLVKRHTVSDVLEDLAEHPEGGHAIVACPLETNGRSTAQTKVLLSEQGYARIITDDGRVMRVDDVPDDLEGFELVLDRVPLGALDEDWSSRAADSIQTAFFEGHGACHIYVADQPKAVYSNRFELDGMSFEEPSPTFFAFNNPHGACPSCEGFGSVLGIDEELVIPNPKLSLYEDAIAPWRGEKLQKWKLQMIRGAEAAELPIHAPIADLSFEQKRMLWKGCAHFEGIDAFFNMLEEKSYKIQNRVMLARYRGKTDCQTCEGTRLRPETRYVKINGISMPEINQWPISKANAWFQALTLDAHDAQVAERVLVEIQRRLDVLQRVGLEYLNLNRPSGTLSGGESQRIHLATSLGSNLVGSLYILDEPSIGLHPRDTEHLLDVLKTLRDHGNTVIVVEHDEQFMMSADTLIDMGPGAGSLGGEVVYSGPGAKIRDSQTLTSDYLTGRSKIERQQNHELAAHWVDLTGARMHNLKDVNIRIPLNRLTAVCGVSGSGKTTLIKNILVPAIQKHLGEHGNKGGHFDELGGEIHRIRHIELVDQNPIGKSSRSNATTYLKVYDDMRAAFAEQKAAKVLGLQAKHFSFNTDGGRCDVCKGDGYVTVEMQFMADVHLTCDHCQGKRFKDEVLQVQIGEQHISDVLEMTIEDAQSYFLSHGYSKISQGLQPLIDVGLGYVHVGQPSSTLSGGEAQRVKLASYLAKGHRSEPVLFVFDEPTTGLHFDDVQKLLKAYDALIAMGHSVLVIEHHTDVLRWADWMIELGPEGGEQGGQVLFQGRPYEVHECAISQTARYLR